MDREYVLCPHMTLDKGRIPDVKPEVGPMSWFHAHGGLQVDLTDTHVAFICPICMNIIKGVLFDAVVRIDVAQIMKGILERNSR